MWRSSKAKLAVAATFLLGLGVAIALIVWSGADAVLTTLAAGGWGLVGIVPYYLIPLAAAALSWRLLFPPDAVPHFRVLLQATWIGLAINWLLPVAQLGGEVVKARLVMGRHSRTAPAVASVVVDQTLQIASQVVYALAGVVLLLVLVAGQGAFSMAALGFALLLAIGLYAFYRVQRLGMFGVLARAVQRFTRSDQAGRAAERADDLDRRVTEVYGRRPRLGAALAWRLAFRVATVGEIWLALWLMGHPVSLAEAMILDSLGQAVRSAAFAIPAGIGAQEGAFVAISVALGLPPQAGIAVALARRFRELAVGVPALVAWQVTEARALRGPEPR
ncbi:MAG: TIGR00374 family protein [Rhodospirillales bacterium]|nr:MAG: TIGR00374 family protein [Rhodospirillales bacterium]